MSAMKLLGCLAILCATAGGCCTGYPPSKSTGVVLVRGHEINTRDRTLRLPGGSDLLAVVQRVREAGGFREGIYRMTVSIAANGKEVTRIIDLRKISLAEASATTFEGGTLIYVVETP